MNNFTIHVATENGSGSQSSNLILMRSLFNMGIPVCGKNLFPSNIQGLPTWFTTRISGSGHTALTGEVDVLVAMNRVTAVEDIMELPEGAVVITEHTEMLHQHREDLTFYTVPFTQLAGEMTKDFRFRKLLTNMLYVGALKELFGIEEKAILQALKHQFKTKPKVVDLNMDAIKKGAEYVKKNVKKIDDFKVKRIDKTKGKILIEGNAACALGALNAGCTVLTWYPITPSSSLCEKVEKLFTKYRRTKDGKANYAVIQAEDEIAALGAAVGAGWAGARAMTSTSGPGISLMTEFIGLAYFTEIPVVIFDVQRVGPSTGMPTRTSQGDVLSNAYCSHGDTKHPLFIPGNPIECYEFSMQAFDMADRYQGPVFVMSDLDLGMNYWMTDPLKLPKGSIDRGKVLDEKQLKSAKKFGRYRDVDGDGIPYRVLPGTKHKGNAFLTRGSGHTPDAEYSEKPGDYEYLMDRLARKFETMSTQIPEPIITQNPKSRIGMIYYGSTEQSVHEAIEILQDEHDIEVNHMRIRGFPFHKNVAEFIQQHDRIYIVEMNRDAQMKTLLGAEVGLFCREFVPITSYTGHPIHISKIINGVLAREKK